MGDGDLIIQAATFNQDGGSTSARHIDIAAADISNAGGTIVQSGTESTHIAASGALNNDRGTIATNGADLRLEAGGKLSNANGHVQHAGTGTLAITAGNYGGSGGEVVGNSTLVARVSGAFNQDGGHISARQITIDAALISNRGGQIVQTDSGTLHAHVAGMLDNDAGLIGTTSGSKGAVDLKFQTLANQGGRISSDGDLSVESTGDRPNA